MKEPTVRIPRWVPAEMIPGHCTRHSLRCPCELKKLSFISLIPKLCCPFWGIRNPADGSWVFGNICWFMEEFFLSFWPTLVTFRFHKCLNQNRIRGNWSVEFWNYIWMFGSRRRILRKVLIDWYLICLKKHFRNLKISNIDR